MSLKAKHPLTPDMIDRFERVKTLRSLKQA